MSSVEEKMAILKKLRDKHTEAQGVASQEEERVATAVSPAKVAALRRLCEKRQARTRQHAEEASVVHSTADAEHGHRTDIVPGHVGPVDASTADCADAACLVSGKCTLLAGSNSGSEAQVLTPGASRSSEPPDLLFCRGHCAEHGLHGHSKNETKAASLYRQAAEAGHLAAAWRLGELHEAGNGVHQSGVEAEHWYRFAAQAGNMHAQSALALLLEDGRGVPINEVEALRWHLLAAEQGHALSMYCAAHCLNDGRGAPQDSVSARLWLLRSAASGFQPAMDELTAEEDELAAMEGLEDAAARDVSENDSVDESDDESEDEAGASFECSGDDLAMAEHFADLMLDLLDRRRADASEGGGDKDILKLLDVESSSVLASALSQCGARAA
eukprot:gnl/TRDRNA2_/TRDRNA2_181639_c0_seq1.p1 gnl/TRDRNA2_/TRDRNA2_181639_c0~~gnl/TRDRNA2_/TRDRNA2_181639_c0_seq1.p1  ORF type:complete len:413 (-),score=85.32 gnl/TRDRNA2_/TRDRNA2_181639_c0_seq1:186-1343(-)